MLSMLGRFSLKMYLLNLIFLKSLRRAGILMAELKCGSFETGCHGIRKSVPKSTVKKKISVVRFTTMHCVAGLSK